jgi:transketolase
MKYHIDLDKFVDTDGTPKATEKSSMRDAFGDALVECGENENFVVLGADLDKSTKTLKFKDKFGEYGSEAHGTSGRWISCGVSEAFMCGTAGGFAARGVKPVLTTFARFLGRGYETLLQSVVIPGFSAFVLGSHGGIAVGKDGGSAQAIEDVAFFRALHNVTVLSPSDPVETKLATKAGIADSGVVYMRLSRNNFPNIFGPDYQFKIGEGVELIPGEKVTLVTTGEPTSHALSAVAMLRKEGLNPRLIHMPTIQPPDQDILAEAAENTELFVSVEDHSPRGGLGDAVLEALSDANVPRRVLKIGVEHYAESGSPAELYAKYGIDAAGITSRTLRALNS